jgi:hypothetical protein
MQSDRRQASRGGSGLEGAGSRVSREERAEARVGRRAVPSSDWAPAKAEEEDVEDKADDSISEARSSEDRDICTQVV